MAPLSPLHVEGCARLGRMRLNAARLNVYEAIPGGVIDTTPITGGGPGTGLRIEGAAIQHALNDQPDTASFRARGIAPVAGQVITVTTGDTDLGHTLFGGRIIETALTYESAKQNLARDLRCIDHTWIMQRRRVLASYVGQSASVIVQDLVARFCRGITTRGVVGGLPIIDAITFTNENLPQCLTAICERIGGAWYVDFGGDLHVFLNEAETAAPITDADPRTGRAFVLAEDLSQVITRVVGRGGGVGAAIDVAVGATEVPVNEGDAATWYSATGGLVEVGTQVLTYTGIKGRGGVGALIGTGNTPTSPLTVTGMSGAGLSSGTYQWAQTFANATGETLPGPVKALQIGGTIPALFTIAARRNPAPSNNSGLTPTGLYSFRVALLYAGGGFALGPPTATVQPLDTNAWQVGVGLATTDPVSGFLYYPSLMSGTPAEILQTQIFRTTNGGASWFSVRNHTGVYISPDGWIPATDPFWTDSNITTNPQYPTGPVATFGRALVKAPMPALPPGFTSTNLYRTAANGTQLRRLATAVNPAVDYTDSAADATLGANAPTSDTSGIVASSSLNVAAGATEIIVTSVEPFTADGGAGWARIGDLVIRYTGTAANKLTGVPAIGPGALTATVRYGATVLVQPRLVGIPAAGVGAVQQAIRKGDVLVLRVELEDAAAIAVMAERLKLPGAAAVTADGVIEDVVTDSRFGLAELTAYCRARLAERKDPTLTVTFESRDDSLAVGRLVTITLTQPPISGTFRVQRIAFSEIAITGALGRVRPLRRVEATNKLFTFANLLRQLRGREGGVP